MLTREIARKIRYARNVNKVPALKLAMKYNISIKTVYNIAGGYCYPELRWIQPETEVVTHGRDD